MSARAPGAITSPAEHGRAGEMAHTQTRRQEGCKAKAEFFARLGLPARPDLGIDI